MSIIFITDILKTINWINYRWKFNTSTQVTIPLISLRQYELRWHKKKLSCNNNIEALCVDKKSGREKKKQMSSG